MKPGHYTITAELMTVDQQPVPGPMNKVTRIFDVGAIAVAPAQVDGTSPATPATKSLTPTRRQPTNAPSHDFQD
jgi:hypothetical protein